MSAQTVNAFLKQYLEDQWSSRPRTLEQYIEIFPGADQIISEHYARLESEASDRSALASPTGRIGPLPRPRRARPRRTRGRLPRRGRPPPPDRRAQGPDGARLAGAEQRRAVPARGRGRFQARPSRASRPCTRSARMAAFRSSRCGSSRARRSRHRSAGKARPADRDPSSREVARPRRESGPRSPRRARGRHHPSRRQARQHLIQTDGNPVIVDFGLAHDADADLADPHEDRRLLRDARVHVARADRDADVTARPADGRLVARRRRSTSASRSGDRSTRRRARASTRRS